MTALRRNAARRWAVLLAAPFALAGLLTAGAPAVASAAVCIRVTGLPMPADPQGLDQALNGTAVLGPCDAWAVGATGGSTVANLTLTEHYDGSGWRNVPSPNAGQSAAKQRAHGRGRSVREHVQWLGSTSHNEHGQTLIEHWDGSS